MFHFLVSVPRSALGPTQPAVKWVPRGPFRGVKRGRGVTLTSHLVPRSGIRKSYTSSPPMRLRGV